MGSETDEDAAGILTSLSINISPKKGGRAGQAGGSKRNARRSVAASDAASGPMTLREQEQASAIQPAEGNADRCRSSTR